MLAMSMALCGCVGTTPTPETLYVLRVEAPPAAAATLPLTLKIAHPEVAPGLESPRVALLQAPHRFTYYTGSEWADPLPDMALTFLVDAFERSHAFRAVGRDTDVMKSDLALLTDIRECHVDDSGDIPTVKLRLSAKLVTSIGREVLVSIPVEKTAAAEGKHMSDIVAAFNRVFNEAAKEMITVASEAAVLQAHLPVQEKPGELPKAKPVGGGE